MTPWTLKLGRGKSVLRWGSRAWRAHLTVLSAMELIMLEKQYSCLPSFFAVKDAVPVDCLTCFASTSPDGSVNCSERY